MTALRPGQSPPPVSIATRIVRLLGRRPTRSAGPYRRRRPRNVRPPMSVVIAIDAGTTGVRAFALRDDGTAGRLRLPRVHPALPAARAGSSTTPPRSGRPCRRPSPSWSAELDRADRRHRHHRPARDGRGLGPPHRPAAAPRHRVAGPPHRGPLRRSSGPRATSRSCGATTGLVLDPYFSATKAEWLLTEGGVAVDARPGPRHRSTPGCCGTSPAGPTAGCTPPSRRTPAARCSSTSARWPGPTSCSTCSACPRRRCPRCGRRAAASASRPTGSGAARRHPGVGHRRRPAGRAVRPGLPRARHDQEHLRHRAASCSCTWATPAPSRSTGCSPRSAGRWPTAPRAYALEGAIFVTGAAVQWLRDGLGIIERAERDRRAGRDACPTPSGVRRGARPSPASGSPWWDPYARGTIVGITRGTGRAHLARAVLESIASRPATWSPR